MDVSGCDSLPFVSRDRDECDTAGLRMLYAKFRISAESKDIPRENNRRIIRPETLDYSRKDNSGDTKKGNAADEGHSVEDGRTSGSQRHFTFGHRYHSLGIPGHHSADGAIILPMSRYFEGFFRYFRRIYPPSRIAYAYAKRHMRYISHFPWPRGIYRNVSMSGPCIFGKIAADDAARRPTEETPLARQARASGTARQAYAKKARAPQSARACRHRAERPCRSRRSAVEPLTDRDEVTSSS